MTRQTAVARSTSGGLGAIGILTTLLGAWAGIVVFAGPVFGYSVEGRGAWHWSAAHGLLHLAPGAAAFLAGLIILASAPSGVARGGSAFIGSLLAVAAGAWLVIGPIAWPVLQGNGHRVWNAAPPLHELAYQVGANLGPGAILILTGALALGLVSRTTVSAPLSQQPPVGATRAAA